MAGIGFRLRDLSRRGTVSSILAAAGHAALIAAGPWIFTIASLALITLATDRVAGLAALADFRAIVIYAFATSLVFSAPITIVATRLVGDALWLRRPQDVPGLFVAATALAMPPVAAAVAAEIAYFRPPAAIAVVLMAASLVVSMIWVAVAFSGAVRDFRGITLSFVAGLGLAVALCVGAAVLDAGAAGIAVGFIAGLTITAMGLASRVLATFPQALSGGIFGPVAEVLRGMGTYWTLALGAILGAAGVWIDKWVFWFSSAGESVSSGLLHAPIYDSTMFIASLSLIPALAAFVMRLETGFFERYQQYYATISAHGTLAQIEGARQRIASYTLDNMVLITIVQAGLAAILVLMAPILIDALSLQFRQIAILRFGALGAMFQFVFIAATALLLFFDRRRLFLLTQVLYLVLNASLAIVSLRLGEDFYGVGYFVAAVASALVAFWVAGSTIERLNFLTFIGNNPTIITSAGRPNPLLGYADAVGRWFARRFNRGSPPR